MAHDGQDTTNMTASAVLPDLLTLTKAALPAVQSVFDSARVSVRAMVSKDDKISGALVEANQTAAHGLSWLATYHQSLQQMQRWAESLNADGNFGEMEQLLHQIAFGEYLHQIAGGGHAAMFSQGNILVHGQIRPLDVLSWWVKNRRKLRLCTPELV